MQKQLAAFAILGLAACQNAGGDPDRLARAFDLAMFEIDPDTFITGAAAPLSSARITRWQGAVRYEIRASGPVPAAILDRLQERLQLIRKITGVKIAPFTPETGTGPAGQAGQPELVIQFDPRTTMRIVRTGRADCFTRILSDPSGRLIHARIVIPRRKEAVLHHCIDHELMHAMGFRAHLTGVPSVLNSRHRARALTRWDRHLLAALYHPGLRAGLDRKEASATTRLLLSRGLDTAALAPGGQPGPR